MSDISYSGTQVILQPNAGHFMLLPHPDALSVFVTINAADMSLQWELSLF